MTLERASTLAPWLVATLALLLTAWLFYPGFMSFDSAYQWSMVRSGEWVDVHSPLMNLVWTGSEQVLPGPGGPLLLHLLLFWSGLAVLACALYRRPGPRVLLVLALGFWPALLALLPFIWKDVGLLVAMIWVVALLAAEQRRPSRALRLAAVLALAVACAYRHNALPLVLPLAWHLVGRQWPQVRALRRMGLAAVLFVVIALLAQLPARLPNVEHRDVWTATTLWDLAAVSIVERRMLLPPMLADPSLDVQELERLFVPYSNTTIFATGKIKEGVSSRLSQAERDAASSAWAKLWLDHPDALIRHRLRVSALLFGFEPAAVPNELVYLPLMVQYGDNPSIQLRQPQLQVLLNSVLLGLADSPVFALWSYGLLVLLVLAAVVRRGWAGRHPLLLPVLLSALLYVLPLVIVAPSAEFRYLAWPVLASLLAVALALAKPESGRSDPLLAT